MAALATEGDSNTRLLFLLITFFSLSGVDNPGDNVLQPDDGDQVGGGVPVPRLQEPTRHHERRQGGGAGLDALLAVFSMLETIVDPLLDFLPGYLLGKCVFLVWCMAPSDKSGSNLVFTQVKEK